MNRTTPSIVLLTALSLPAAGQEAKPPAEQEKVSEVAQPEPVLKLTLREHDLFPESIAYDPLGGDYFLGSLSSIRILRLKKDVRSITTTGGTADGSGCSSAPK